ncbi:unnamed protein product [Closterium sp. NIES-53]
MVKTQMAKAKAKKQQAKQQGSTSASPGASKALAPRPKGVSFSFQSGMQELPLSLAAHIPASALRLSHRVDALSCDLHSPPHRPSWSLSVTRVGDGGSGGKGGGGKAGKGEQQSERFDAVVVTVWGRGWDGMGWDGMGWDGMGWDGMGWDGMGWDGMGMGM